MPNSMGFAHINLIDKKTDIHLSFTFNIKEKLCIICIRVNVHVLFNNKIIK